MDATILQSDPGYRVKSIRPGGFRPPKDWSNRGEMTREIAMQLLMEQALDRSNVQLLRLMTKRVGVAPREQRHKGVVRSDQGPGPYQLREMAR